MFACVCVSVFVSVRVSVGLCVHVYVVYGFCVCICLVSFLVILLVNRSSLSTGFQVYLSKCWDPYVSPGCTARLAFFWVFLLCFSILILSLPLLGLGPSLPLLALGSVYVGQGSTIRLVGSWISFLDSLFFFSWLIVWADGINKCGWCLAGGRGC